MSTETDTFEAERETVELIRSSREKIDSELSKAIVGQKGAKSITLLGMSYLSRAGGFKVVGNRLILGE